MKDTTKELFREIALNAMAARMKVVLELTDNDEHSTAIIAKRDNNTQALKLTCLPNEEAAANDLVEQPLQEEDEEGEDCGECFGASFNDCDECRGLVPDPDRQWTQEARDGEILREEE